VDGDQVTTRYDDARGVMSALADAGIDYVDVIATLEQEGVDKFAKSWDQLVDTVRGQVEASERS
jgi:transaldolase